MVKVRHFIMGNHIAEDGVKLSQRVVLNQVDVAVPDGDIPLGIHLAEISQLDLIGLFLRGQVNGTHGVVQPILPIVLHTLNDKSRAEGLELLQQFVDLVLAHRKLLVPVIKPCLIPMERQSFALVFPGEGLNGVAGQLQDRFAAVLDLFLAPRYLSNRKGGDTGYNQNTQQNIKFFRPAHFAASFYAIPPQHRYPGTPAGMRRSSAPSALRRWNR